MVPTRLSPPVWDRPQTAWASPGLSRPWGGAGIDTRVGTTPVTLAALKPNATIKAAAILLHPADPRCAWAARQMTTPPPPGASRDPRVGQCFGGLSWG